MATHNLSREERNERNETRSKKSGAELQTDPSSSTSEQLERSQEQARTQEHASASASTISRAFNNPFVLMRRMFEDMDRVFDGLGLGFPTFPSPISTGFLGSRWSPGLDVFEREGKLIIRADLPGMSQEDIHIEVEGDNTLVLQGERRNEQAAESNGIWRSERTHGAFRRTMRLPRGMDVDNASAHFGNGVLEISIALPPERQKRRIAIKSNDSPDAPGSAAKSNPSPVH